MTNDLTPLPTGPSDCNQLAPTEPHRDHCVLRLPSGLPYERWVAEGEKLLQEIKDGPWYLGDWFLFGTTHYSEDKYTAALTVTSRKLQTLYNCRSVAKSFPPERRRAGLKWGHHQAAQGLSEQAADALLLRAEQEDWSVEDVRQHVKGDDAPPRVSSPQVVEDVDTELFGTTTETPTHEQRIERLRELTLKEKLPSAVGCRVCGLSETCDQFKEVLP